MTASPLAAPLAPEDAAPRAVGVIHGGPQALRKAVENAVLVAVPTLGTVICPFWFLHHALTWIELTAFLIGYAVIGFGVSIGLHRTFSHRSLRPKPWLAFALGAAGTMSMQGSLLRWVADHRRHHAATDDCGDLHSPHVDSHCTRIAGWRGLFHAHMGWLWDDAVSDYAVYGHDLLRDPLVMFFHRSHWFWVAMTLVFPWLYGYVLGGADRAWGCLLFAGCFRTFLFHHATWAVNSIGHSHGYENFAQSNNSKNNLALALLTFGDGWHNNHHRFPRSAFHGLTRREIDVSGGLITGLERLGLVTDVIRVPPARLALLRGS
ncbi:acyl-CoA desaturase [Methylobacterium nigriterrae]|uniref:acyl-CoA desaturase n=1 Tax=Methylobacterium nigriterrae TaxID=3127512 RepID=UPI003013368A